jgi:hypothetical protein
MYAVDYVSSHGKFPENVNKRGCVYDQSADVYEKARKESYYTSVLTRMDLCKERTTTQ